MFVYSIVDERPDSVGPTKLAQEKKGKLLQKQKKARKTETMMPTPIRQESYAQQMRAKGSAARDFRDVDWYTSRDAAEFFGVKPHTIVLWIKAGYIHAQAVTKGGKGLHVGRWLIHWTEIDYIENHGRDLIESEPRYRRLFPRIVYRAQQEGKLKVLPVPM